MSQEELLYKKGLPCNLDAERFVLGSILLNDACWVQVDERLSIVDFSIEKHRRIFGRMKEVFERGERLDRVTVANELMKQGQLESIDGLSYLVSLDEGIPEIENLDGYIRIVREKSTLRQIVHTMQRVIERSMMDRDDPDGIILEAVDALQNLGEQTSIDDGIVSTHEMIARDGLDKLLGPRSHGAIKLPLARVDEALNGLTGGQVAVLMARTSRGKSSLAYQIAFAAAKQRAHPVIWTLEVSPEEAFQCIAQQVSGVWPSKHWLTLEDRRELNMAGCQLDEDWIYFDSRARSVPEFVARLRRVQRRAKLGMAVVDHLQLIRSDSRYRAQEVSNNSRALKLAAMDLNIPFVVLSQVDRASVKGDGKIGLHSGKESGDIENDADVVMWLDSEEEFSWEHDTHASLHIGKNRNGRAGVKIPLVFQPSRRAFSELAD